MAAREHGVPQPAGASAGRVRPAGPATRRPDAGRAPVASWDLAAIGLTAPPASLHRAVREADAEHGDGVMTTPAEMAAAQAAADLRTGASADIAARAFGADAVTVGAVVRFRRGAWDATTESGQALIAHELAHVSAHRRTGATAPLLRVAGDPLLVHFSPADAAALTDAELDQLLGQLRRHLSRQSDPAAAENLALLEDEAATRHAAARPDAPVPVDPTAAAVASINQYATVLSGLVAEYRTRITDHPERMTLTEARELAAALDRAVGEIRGQSGSEAVRTAAAGAAARVERLREEFRPSLAAMTTYHAANDPGRSLGMWNEDTGTWLAGVGEADWEHGGVLYRARASGAYVGAFLVAVLDAGETLLSFGFHDVATQVGRAYHAGNLSVEDGNRIIWDAAWRTLLAAAVAAATGRIATRLATVGLARARLGYTAARVGGGVVGGMASGATATGFTDLFTRALSQHMTSARGQAIWNSARPSGRDWAIAIGFGALFGGLGAARASEVARRAAIGTRHHTPWGEVEVVAVTSEGTVVVQPVGARVSPVRAPAPGPVDLVYDPSTGVWEVPGAPVAPPAAVVPAPTVPATLLPPATLSPRAALPAPRTAPRLPPGPPPPLLLPAPAAESPAPSSTPGPLATPPVERGPIITPPPAPEIVPFVSRLSSAEAALDSARAATASARTALAQASESLGVTEQWIAQEGTSADARALRDLERRAVRDLTTALRDLERSEASAVVDAARARAAVDRVAPLVDRLVTGTREYQTQLRARGQVRPPTSSPLGLLEHELRSLRAALDAERAALAAWEGEVASYTPGAAGQPLALRNVSRLGAPLWNGSQPIDVLTGNPPTGSWTVDHIVPRTRIAADPRFWRLTPANRQTIMLGVEANYLPLSGAANSSKGGSSVAAWAERLRAEGRPLRGDILAALLEAELRAREAVEQAFVRLLAAQGR